MVLMNIQKINFLIVWNQHIFSQKVLNMFQNLHNLPKLWLRRFFNFLIFENVPRPSFFSLKTMPRIENYYFQIIFSIQDYSEMFLNWWKTISRGQYNTLKFMMRRQTTGSAVHTGVRWIHSEENTTSQQEIGRPTDRKLL